MFTSVPGGIIKEHILGIELNSNFSQGFWYDLEVGHNSAAVIHQASVPGLVFTDQGIGNVTHTSVIIPVRVVQSLDATTTGDVVLGCGNFQLGIVFQWPGSLHKAFSKYLHQGQCSG